MNYLHAYHAGNFADCIKHAVLVQLLQHLLEKPAPLLYIDTHAGAGRYLLDAVPVGAKAPEYLAGIAKLYGVKALAPELQRYVDLVRGFNELGGAELAQKMLRGNSKASAELSVYPGSPQIAQKMLRAQDHLLLFEEAPEVAKMLQHWCGQHPRTKVLAQDGYQGVRAALPPAATLPKRVLLLIDPPFEAADEWQQAFAALEAGLKRFSTGVYVLWYPIKMGRDLARHYRRARQLCEQFPLKSALSIEFCVHPDESTLRLNGCGMMIFNAPFRFEQSLVRLAEPLHKLLKVEPRARWSWQWLQQPA